MPPLDTLVAFESVARLQSFTRAAAELCVTQSAVSKQIRTLEQALGVELFTRQARGVKLSPSGLMYHDEVLPALHRIHTAGQRVSATRAANTVTVLATHAVSQFWLFPRLLGFSAIHPEITVNINATNDIQPFMVPDCDLAILYGNGDWPDVESASMIPEVVYPVALPGCPGTRVSTLDELAALPLIQLTSAWDCMEWKDWFAHFNRAYQPPKSAPTFNQLTLTYAATLQGAGISLAWDFMAADVVSKGELVRVTEFAAVTGLAEFVAHDASRPLSPAARVFKDWLLQEGAQTRSAQAVVGSVD